MKDIEFIPESPSADAGTPAPRSPVDLPFASDEIVSASFVYYGRPVGLRAEFWFSRWARKLLKRSPRMQHLVIYVRYREGGERFERTLLPSTAIPKVIAGLAEAATIREFTVCEALVKHHKSFGEDYDVSRWPNILAELAKSEAREAAPKASPQGADAVGGSTGRPNK